MKVRIGLAALLSLALAQIGVRRFVRPVTDTWTVVGADADGAMLWTWLQVSNTGILDGQLTTRLLLLPIGPSFVEHRAQWGPAELDDDGASAGSDRLRRTEAGWDLEIGGDGFGARLSIAGTQTTCPPRLGTMRGMLEDGVDGRILSGPVLLARQHVEGHPEGTALYVLGDRFAAGIDPLSSECPAWVRTPTATWTGAAATFPVERTSALRLGDWDITFRSAGMAIEQDGWAHALAAERLLARAFGFRPPITAARRAVVRVEGPGLASTLAPALVLERR